MTVPPFIYKLLVGVSKPSLHLRWDLEEIPLGLQRTFPRAEPKCSRTGAFLPTKIIGDKRKSISRQPIEPEKQWNVVGPLGSVVDQPTVRSIVQLVVSTGHLVVSRSDGMFN
jgi:hypothetical protein